MPAAPRRVIVNDSHSTMRNLLIEELDPRATVVSGRVKRDFMLQGLSEECAAAFFIGYHGAIGDACAVMGHTYSPRVIYECRLNGEPVSELPINAAFAGHFGVPVALVSADATTLAEAARVLPWALARGDEAQHRLLCGRLPVAAGGVRRSA